MYSYRGHWIIKNENNNKNKSIALASLLQFGFFHGGFTPGVTGCDSSTVGAAESGVRSYLTQGKLPVPAALTSHPLHRQGSPPLPAAPALPAISLERQLLTLSLQRQ